MPVALAFVRANRPAPSDRRAQPLLKQMLTVVEMLAQSAADSGGHDGVEQPRAVQCVSTPCSWPSRRSLDFVIGSTVRRHGCAVLRQTSRVRTAAGRPADQVGTVPAAHAVFAFNGPSDQAAELGNAPCS